MMSFKKNALFVTSASVVCSVMLTFLLSSCNSDPFASSLSAILLNEDFYSFMLEGRKTILGASVLGAEYLIPFKMYAWHDLKDRKDRSEHVNERDYKKHKYDVF